MSRRVTQLVKSKSEQHGGKGNALNKSKPRAVSQAAPNIDTTNKAALAESQAQQADGVEQMASRMKKFQGPWSAVPQSTDDNIEGGY